MNDSTLYLDKTVSVKIDRPLGSTHPKHGFFYPVNYGYVPNTISGDGEELDCYVLGVHEPVETFEGKCIAFIHRTNDNDDKLIVVPDGKNFSNDEIRALTDFQEQFFESEIIRNSNGLNKFKEIRPIALGLAIKDNKMLVSEGFDEVKNQTFYRCLGGGIEFFEKSDDALRREFLEEINTNIKIKDFLGISENMFTFNGKKAHEIIFLYSIEIDNSDFKPEYEIIDEENSIAKWISIDEFKNKNKILYPDAVFDFI